MIFWLYSLCNQMCLELIDVMNVYAIHPLFQYSPVQSNSSMHHYKCVALYKDITLQRGWFWASSVASCSSRSRKERSPWMVFIRVVRGHPGGRLQLLRGCSKMTWLASAFSSVLARCPKKERWRDLTMDESGGWLVIWWTSTFLTKSCHLPHMIIYQIKIKADGQPYVWWYGIWCLSCQQISCFSWVVCGSTVLECDISIAEPLDSRKQMLSHQNSAVFYLPLYSAAQTPNLQQMLCISLKFIERCWTVISLTQLLMSF